MKNINVRAMREVPPKPFDHAHDNRCCVWLQQNTVYGSAYQSSGPIYHNHVVCVMAVRCVGPRST